MTPEERIAPIVAIQPDHGSVRWGALTWAQRGTVAVMALCLAGIAGLVVWAGLHPSEGPGDAAGVSTSAPTPAVQLVPSEVTAVVTTALSYRVGLLAGHWQYDSGAVCPDGLREVDITLPVAQRVASILQQRGCTVDVLGEYDERLVGYEADVFVAIHADSCDLPGASGFKIARAEDSFIPETEDRLVDCLWKAYRAATGLTSHPGSITPDMLLYHAFGAICPQTPGVIIELGFLLEDRALLEARQEDIAVGIVNGVACFLEGMAG